jgi:glycosyltransferase involved in cell wall biosynthesis
MVDKPTLLIVDGPEIAGRISFVTQLSKKFRVVVAGSNPEAEKHYRDIQIPYTYIPFHRGANPFKDLRLLLRLVRLVRTEKPDISHTFGSKLSVWGRIAARIGGSKYVTGTITGLGSLYTGDSVRKRFFRFIFESLQRVAARFSDMTVFQNSRDLELYRTKNIVGERKSTLIPGSGVDTHRFSPANRDRYRSVVRESLSLESETVVVLMVTRLIRTKGVNEFAIAARSAKSAGLNAVFILVGPVDSENIDQLTADELSDVERDVTYLGPRNDIPELMAAADLFVLPTLYREGIPRAVLEAASMGLPVVTTTAGSGGVAVVDGENGFIVDGTDQNAVNSKIFELIASGELRRDFGLKSRSTAVEKLDVSIISDQYSERFRKLISAD